MLHSLLADILSLRRKRARIALQNTVPCLGAVSLIALGQFTGLVLSIGENILLVLGVSSILFIFLRKRGFSLFLIGLFLSLICFSRGSLEQLSSSHAYYAKVTDSPRFKRPGELEVKLKIFGVLNGNSVDRFARARIVLCKAVYLPWKNVNGLREGDEFFLRAKFYQLKAEINPFTYSSSLFRKGIRQTCKIQFTSRVIKIDTPWSAQVRNSLLKHIESVLGSGEVSGLFLSMGLGVRDVISEKTERAFRLTGMSHLLVVSGYQVGLVYFMIYLVLSRISVYWLRFFRSPYTRSGICLVALTASILFVELTGADSASLRALIAIVLVSICEQFERGRGVAHRLCLSLMILSLLWPCSFLEPGVHLTYAALFGIFLGMKLGSGSIVKAYLYTNVFASLCASLCALIWFGNFSVLGLIMNPLAASLVSFISCYVGFLGILLSLVGIPWILQGVSWVLELFRDFVIWNAEAPWVSIQPEGEARVFWITVPLLFIAFFCFKKLDSLAIEYNLYRGDA